MTEDDKITLGVLDKREGERFYFNRDAVEYMFDQGWLIKLDSETAGDTCNRVLSFLKKEYMIK